MEVTVLIGKTLLSVQSTGNEIVFQADDGSEYKMYHSQDCCESVYVESIVGDLTDLVGEPILNAEQVSSDGMPPVHLSDADGSFTWTFYKFATRKGYVDIRWYGSSNGYYSEGVDFEQTAAATA